MVNASKACTATTAITIMAGHLSRLCDQAIIRIALRTPARIRLTVALSLLLLCFFFLAPAARAADIPVDSTADNTNAGDQQCTLREAVNNANADADTTSGDCPAGSGADTIWLENAVYPLLAGSAPIEDANASDDLDILPTGGDLTIHGDGSFINGPGVVLYTNRVLHINPADVACDISVSVIGVTIQAGHTGQGGGGIRNNRCILNVIDSTIQYNEAVYGGGASDDGDGGGIHCDNGTLNVIDSTISNNVSRGSVVGEVNGGGINVRSCVGSIVDSRIANNEVRTIWGAGFPAANGGGLRNACGSLTVINSEFSGNRATHVPATVTEIGSGGAIYNTGELRLEGCTLSGNEADILGGAIHNDSTMEVQGSSLTDNEAGSSGGAIHNTSRLEVAGSEFLRNASGEMGGAIYSDTPEDVSVHDSTLAHNTAESDGGAIYHSGAYLELADSTLDINQAIDSFGGGMFSSGNVVATGSTFSGNRAAVGGGLISMAGSEVANCTFSGNGATWDGGGIANVGTMDLILVTVAGNEADVDKDGTGDGGGVINAGTVNLNHTLVYKNRDQSPVGSVHPDLSGAFNSIGYNLIGDGTGWPGPPHVTDQVGTTLSPIDAKLGSLADNGGPTWTHALLPTSPALDVSPCAGVLGTDQRGRLRPDFGGFCDTGAFELGGLLRIYLPTVLKLYTLP